MIEEQNRAVYLADGVDHNSAGGGDHIEYADGDVGVNKENILMKIQSNKPGGIGFKTRGIAEKVGERGQVVDKHVHCLWIDHGDAIDGGGDGQCDGEGAMHYRAAQTNAYIYTRLLGA